MQPSIAMIDDSIQTTLFGSVDTVIRYISSFFIKKKPIIYVGSGDVATCEEQFTMTSDHFTTQNRYFSIS